MKLYTLKMSLVGTDVWARSSNACGQANFAFVKGMDISPRGLQNVFLNPTTDDGVAIRNPRIIRPNSRGKCTESSRPMKTLSW